MLRAQLARLASPLAGPGAEAAAAAAPTDTEQQLTEAREEVLRLRTRLGLDTSDCAGPPRAPGDALAASAQPTTPNKAVLRCLRRTRGGGGLLLRCDVLKFCLVPGGTPGCLAPTRK